MLIAVSQCFHQGDVMPCKMTVKKKFFKQTERCLEASEISPQSGITNAQTGTLAFLFPFC